HPRGGRARAVRAPGRPEHVQPPVATRAALRPAPGPPGTIGASTAPGGARGRFGASTGSRRCTGRVEGLHRLPARLTGTRRPGEQRALDTVPVPVGVAGFAPSPGGPRSRPRTVEARPRGR